MTVINAPESDETLATVLAARRYLYKLLWLALADESGSEAVLAMGEPLAAEAGSLMSDGDESLAASHKAVASACDELRARVTDVVADIRRDYSKTFIGPGKLPSYPWESMHVEEQPGLFLESTLAVRHAYAKHGFQSTRLNAEPDDHVATELHFMTLLSEKTLDAFESGDEDLLRSLMRDQVDFLDEHLGKWIGDYAREVDESAQSPLFASVICYASEFVCADATSIRALSR